MRNDIAMTIVLCLFLGYTPVAQTRSPEAQLRAAQHKEQVEGNLKGAIELYKELSARPDIARHIAAEALLGLAHSYEKLGATEARSVYERIIRNYSDQAAIVAAARDRVTALAVSPSRGLVTHQLLELSSSISTLALFPDGRIGATHWETGDLVIVDPATSAVSTVVQGDFKKAIGATWAESPALSPDGRQLAYLWFGADPKEEKGVLCLLPMEKNARPRTIVADPQMRNITPIGWSADSRSILVSYEKPVPDGSGRPNGRGDFDLAWVTADRGVVRRIRTFEWWHSGGGNSLAAVRVSPDGGWIAYALRDRQGSVDRSIFVMRADGSGHRRVVTGGVNDYPVWTPDGSRLVFLSTRSGDPALWSVDVEEKGDGAPALIKNGVGRLILHGMLPTGVLVYSEAGVDPLVVAELAEPLASSQAPALKPVQTVNGLVPSWSPDGRHLAYKRRSINPSRPVELVVQSLDTGELRTYVPRTGTMGSGQPTWHSDGTVQAVTKSGVRLKLGVAALEEVTVPATLPMGFTSPDGRTVYANVPNGGVEAFDVTTGARVATLPVPKGWRAAGLSPNGRTFALILDGPANLAVIGVDGNGFRPLTTRIRGRIGGREAGRPVVWTRDGSALLVAVIGDDDRSTIRRVPIDGGPMTTVAAGITGLRSFAVSPDERRIAYSLHRPKTEVWTLDLKASLKQ